jgi:phage protein D
LTEENVALINAKPLIKINGNERADMQQAILFMRVSLPFSGMSHAELRLVNWGVTSDTSESGYAFQQIVHGDRIEIFAGNSNQTAIFDGEITAIEEMYGQGAPRLVLLMEDKLHRLAKQRKSRVFESVSVDDLVRSVLADADLTGDIQVSSDTGVWHQLNETNLAFLQRILWPYEIAVRHQSDAVRVKAEEEDAEPVAINTQSGLTSLRITADLNHQYLAANVKGFNLETGDAINGSNSDSHVGSGQDAKSLLNNLGWGSEDLLVYPFSRNQSEANAWASAAFRKQSAEFLQGDLLVSGNAQLRTGKQIDLSGASDRLNGKYRIVQAQHLFDMANGYKTRLKITRSSWNQH